MALVYADIELINEEDISLAKHHIIGDEDVKHIFENILVDTGALNLCINENIQAQLRLPFVEKRFGLSADGRRIETDVVGPIKIKFKNRTTSCLAMVFPGNNEPLLGVIPLEDLDVLIYPQRQELIVNSDHPYISTMALKGIRKN
jgi:clan AA aspartic protease